MPISSTPVKSEGHMCNRDPLYAMASARDEFEKSTTNAIAKLKAHKQLSVSPINDCPHLDACK